MATRKQDTGKDGRPARPSARDFVTEKLGACLQDTPLQFPEEHFCLETERILFLNRIDSKKAVANRSLPAFEVPGPFRKIYFDAPRTNVGIVTCGGLCPGLNDVIRSITYCCLNAYRVRNVYGFRNGYRGLTAEHASEAVSLTPDIVNTIHEQGGTILGSSRGGQSVPEMVDTLVKFNVSILFTIGGDGTHRGSASIAEEVRRRKLKIGVIGIPKTIDNDISHIHKTFGFDTAVEEARKAINGANVEATGAPNGIGLVRLMGRHAGFIAAHATLASGNVNLCLIPEEPFDLKKVFARVRKRLRSRDHMVIVVAEGVGQDLLIRQKSRRFDDSGNVKLRDIGPVLSQKIGEHLIKQGIPHTLKYIDPSYMIRSTPANAVDSSFCLQLGNYAVHAGMAGRTNALIGYWNQHFCLVPVGLALSEKKVVDIHGAMWRSVLEITS